ncbi:methylated-DNA--[protein]-cysteine S-methyltransferase [Catenovulum sp. SM1970]|uniref:methylated-DNA--[protein]-cysteine S-methyltransferase n=1 Tax=Marinifaba aquimaris TaxID=2741323 RepID=UPI001573A717|nr:methylated-DNA--[protein]-cysteine S-methyltransferase [Marinifaba aquimaris]NTS76786.1 methylated-DNA--[protein]-cysteine S-methyltransferase [Marinifaba aquimaris]
MNKISIRYFKHPYAEFVLGSYDDQLCLCDFRYRKMRDTVDKRLQQYLKASFVEQSNDVLMETQSQLNRYFLGELKSFDLPLLMVGSEFQQAVWRALMNVEYGQTATYKDLAVAINNENAVRAVGTANGANALAIIVPCHRIIGANGELTGYGGGLPMKKRLLELEQNLFI